MTPPPGEGKLARVEVDKDGLMFVLKAGDVGGIEWSLDKTSLEQRAELINHAADAWKDRAVREAVEEEREAIAKHVEDHYWDSCGAAGEAHGKALATAIRARGTK